jgi:hypothetical protein
MFPNFYDVQKVTTYLLCKPEEATDDADLADFLEQNYSLVAIDAFLCIYRANNADEQAWEQAYQFPEMAVNN